MTKVEAQYFVSIAMTILFVRLLGSLYLNLLVSGMSYVWRNRVASLNQTGNRYTPNEANFQPKWTVLFVEIFFYTAKQNVIAMLNLQLWGLVVDYY